MNHRPFEDWLLDEVPLTPVEQRDLEAHLRVCKQCAALAETGIELSAVRQAAPVPGFALRFQERLSIQRIADRRMRLWGLIVFLLGGVGVLLWLSAPLLIALITSPAQWLTVIVGYVFIIFHSVQTLADITLVFLRVVPGFLPPYIWMVIASVLSGLGLLSGVSVWRLGRISQGA